MTTKKPPIKMPTHIPLYPSENLIAILVLGDRARDWPGVAALDERKGLPKIDPVRGGRYWPAVKAFYDMHNGVSSIAAASSYPISRGIRIAPFALDGEETPHIEKAMARRRGRRKPAWG
ncbi:MAG TPA: hypothetical protein VNQ99_16225 [Xanthobacteraceae bacterium]|nr:hypothetical protein [Xanthobacteraceae bacterium]